MAKSKDVPKNPEPSVKVEGYVKVTIKGKTETLTMQEAEQLKNQLSSVLKDRTQYVPYYPNPVVYPFNNQWDWNHYKYPNTYYFGSPSIGGVSGSVATSGLATTKDSGFTVNGLATATDSKPFVTNFNHGDSVNIGDYTLTFVEQPTGKITN